MAITVFERELKHILQGDLDIIKNVTRSCDEECKKDYLKIMDKPFIVIRAAGSFGVDLVAIRGDVSFPIEVKSSINKKVHFSSGKRLKEQAETFKKKCEDAKLFPVYAFRLKRVRGDAWRIFALDIEGVEGRLRRVYNRLPKISKTKEGNYVLKWEEGMELHRFIDYLC
jgi:Holliday junction resolvase